MNTMPRTIWVSKTMDFVMFKTEPEAKSLCDYLNANGVPAYVKGTGLEATFLELGQKPVVFVDKDQIDVANELYREWSDTSALGEGMTEEEKKEAGFYRRGRFMRICVWVVLIVFVGSVLINAFSIYFH